MSLESINFGLVVALSAISAVLLFFIAWYLCTRRCSFQSHQKFLRFICQPSDSIDQEPFPQPYHQSLPDANAWMTSRMGTYKRPEMRQSLLDNQETFNRYLQHESKVNADTGDRKTKELVCQKPRPKLTLDISEIKNDSIQIAPDQAYGSDRSCELYDTNTSFKAPPEFRVPYQSTVVNSVEPNPVDPGLNSSHQYPVDHALKEIIREGQMFTTFQMNTPRRQIHPMDDTTILETTSELSDSRRQDCEVTMNSSLAWDTFMPTPDFMTRYLYSAELDMSTEKYLNSKSILF